MRKLLMALFILVDLVVIGAVVGGYLFIKSDGFKSSVETLMSESTTTGVTIESIDLHWVGLKLKGIRLPNPNPHQDDFFKTNTLEVNIDWKPLLKKNLVIRSFNIQRPELVLHQSESGGIKLPFKKKAEGAQMPSANKLPFLDGEIQLKTLILKDAKITVFDPSGERLLLTEGADIQGELSNQNGIWKLKSNLGINQLIAGSVLTFDALDSPLSYQENTLELPTITGRCYEGNVKGDARVDFNPEIPTYSFQLEGEGIDMDTLMQSFGKDPGFVEGVLTMQLRGKGNTNVPKDVKGQGSFRVAPVKMLTSKTTNSSGDQFWMFDTVYVVSQVTQTAGKFLGLDLDGTFDALESEFTIRDQLIDYQRLEVLSKSIRINMTGTVSFAKQLDLRGEITIQPGESSLFAQLAGTVADSIRKKGGKIPFKITGNAENPKVEIELVETGLDLGLDLLDSLLGPKQDEDSEEGEKSGGIKSLLDGVFGN
ncbi:MAG: AsmA family protein [Verrucomicrobiota bacterium]